MREVVAACRALGVEPDASDVDIRKSFRRLSLQYHPDRHARGSEDATTASQKFRVVACARDVLTARSERNTREAAEREGYELDGMATTKTNGSNGASEPPVAGFTSKGWGPCPACGGCKRHVGGRTCPIYGKWFDAEKRLRAGDPPQPQRDTVANAEDQPPPRPTMISPPFHGGAHREGGLSRGLEAI